MPDVSTVAIEVAVLLHVPPVVVSDRTSTEPAQTVVPPPIAAGADGIVITEIGKVTELVPQVLEAV